MLRVFAFIALSIVLTLNLGCANDLKREALTAQTALATAQARALDNPLVKIDFGADGKPVSLVVGQPVGNQNLAGQIQPPKSDVADVLREFGGVLNAPLFGVLSNGWAATALAGAVKSTTYDNHATDIRPVTSTDSHAVDIRPVTTTDNHAVDGRPATAPASAP